VESCGLPDGINKLLIMALVEQGKKKQFPLLLVKFDQKNIPKFTQIGDFCRIVESLETFAE
jgi:hypothetical protein